MAAWSINKAGIIKSVMLSVRRLTQNNHVTGGEAEEITNALNMTLIKLATDRSIGVLKVITSDTESTLVANQNYIDLDENVVEVVEGTVRTISEGILLAKGSLAQFYAADISENTTATPSFYAVDGADDSGKIRLRLRPTPSAALTLNHTVKTIALEDSITSFPAWMHPLILVGTKSLALEMLELQNERHERRFLDLLMDAREIQRGSIGPIHVQMQSISTSTFTDPQSRVNS